MLYPADQALRLPDTRFGFLHVEQQGPVLYITLERPAKRNALSAKMQEELVFAFSYAQHCPEVWALVLMANGPVWCAGADLAAFAGQRAAEDASTVPAYEGNLLLGEVLLHVHKPSIACVHAPVYAGGHLLVGGCTHVLAAEDAVFGLPEVKRGLFPFQVMEVLMRNLPGRAVMDWCLRGSTLSAWDAHKLGLVTRVVEPFNLRPALQQLLDELLAVSPKAQQLGIEALHHLQRQQAHGHQTYLKQMLELCLGTEDAREGLEAFQQKRAPVWKGR